MSNDRSEISRWLAEKGYDDDDIGRILERLSAYDQRVNRESLFEDMANGAFDIWPIIAEALKDDDTPPA